MARARETDNRNLELLNRRDVIRDTNVGIYAGLDSGWMINS
jgi:hypothetical protein